MSKIYIGTSGYSYPHWQDVFYPSDLSQSKWLEFYTQYFNTVELNVTFYRLPQESAFKTWHQKTPDDFIFSIKGSRFITHVKKLKDVEESLKLFLDRCSILEEELGVILWQFPPNFKLAIGDKESGIRIERIEKFLKLLISYRLSLNARYAFEFRHESWFCQEVYDLLKQYNCALVIADSPSWPAVEEITANFVYIRFHGGQELYGSNYSQKELKNWAEKIKVWSKQGLDVYCYFNNDAYGYAIENAKMLKRLIE